MSNSNNMKAVARRVSSIGKGSITSNSHNHLELQRLRSEYQKELEKKREQSNEEDEIDVSFFQIFRYGNKIDWLLMAVGTICSIGVGCSFPLNFLIFGNVIDAFLDQAKHMSTPGVLPNSTMSVRPLVFEMVNYFIILAACNFVMAFLQMQCWFLTSDRQSRTIRLSLFRSMMRQNIGWYDQRTPGDLVTKLTEAVSTIEMGIGDKMGTFIQYTTAFIAGMVMSFVRGWKLSLVTCSMVPFVALALFTLAFIMKNFGVREFRAYGKAGAVAEEVLSAIRTVYAFGGERKEGRRYRRNLGDAEKMGIRKSLAIGAAHGFFQFVLLSSAALAFWYGSKLILEEGMRPGVVIQVFFCTIIGSISLGQALPCFEYFANAKSAAASVFGIIERVPEINVEKSGLIPEKLIGHIEFKNISFRYPSREEVEVLHGFNLEVKPGQTIALIGASGSGKSTTVQMLQRFYDPIDGQVCIDGNDLKVLDLSWYRSHVGVVQQEPLLFAGTVIDNIRMGKLDATDEEIENAAKMANAHDFIMKMPEGYNTWIGEGGGQMSGGQKQRVAIARALVRNPTILLLDEATSALDNRSEKVVQAALDKAAAAQDRTVIIIAHRLTTVRSADVIVVMDKGKIVELGNHDELMKQEGWYYDMITKQTTKEDKSKDEEEDYELLDNVIIEEKKEEEVEKEKEEAEVEIARKGPSPMGRVLGMNRPEVWYMVGGCFAALFVGGVQPAFSILYSEMILIFSYVNDPEKMRRESSFYSGLIALAGVLGFLGHLFKNYLLGISGERLTKRLRSRLFRAILRQEIGWFDEVDNQPGVLTTRLAMDASLVKGVSGVRMGMIVESASNMITAIIVAFVFSWKLSLLVLAFMPPIVLVGMIQARVTSGQGQFTNKAVETSGNIAQEALVNIRTIASLGRELFFYEKYSNEFETLLSSSVKQSLAYGLMSGISQSIFYFAYAACFSLGAYLVDIGEIPFVNVFRVFSAITFGSAAIGRASAYAPDLNKAVQAALRTLATIDRKPKIDTSDDVGEKPTAPCTGRVEFENVYFHYPTRTTVPVLMGLNVKAEPSEMVALVGSSGCGKSTVMQLLLRYYNSISGRVLLDGKPIEDLNIGWLRQQIGIVSQEPTLFNTTIRENIAYGDNTREVILDDIIDAAKQANIHGFIAELPMGYDTIVGPRGGQLSGGQKQRVAIARALVRKPVILLLDEATSALDSESEGVVQEALDRASLGRTCLVIAHRLSTIQNADKIEVLQDGRVVERGRHQQLMDIGGLYYGFHHTEH